MAKDQQKVLDMYNKFSDQTTDKVRDYKLTITTKLRKMDYDNELASTHYNFTQFLKVTLALTIMSIIAALSYAYLKNNGMFGILLSQYT